ncbi:endoglucanase [Alicyclobacillus sacchari]|nr:endoglucanase [Alicyclobacillus sacchari]
MVASIHMNQLGYRPQDRKRFYVSGYTGGFVVCHEDGSKVSSGQLQAMADEHAVGGRVSVGDFSDVTVAGRYTLTVPELGQSVSFRVDPNVYDHLHIGLQKFFYFQRCGVDLPPQWAGAWAHAACHTDKAHVYGEPSREIACHGGWHDAGDYGKYVVPAAKAIADLLLAFEFYSEAFTKEVGIPESGLALPDVLSEVRFELEWMLRMQDPYTGGVYHKVTTYRFPSLATMPEDDYGELVLSPISYAATATFAAALAHAARIYQAFDPVFAITCLQAAERAYEWCKAHPATPFRNPNGVFTGEYGDGTLTDEMYWAAASLFQATGEQRYHEACLRVIKAAEISLVSLGWADVGGYGTISYLRADRTSTDEDVCGELRKVWLAEADRLVTLANRTAFGVPLATEDYIWGSNMVLFNRGMHLLIAATLAASDSYVDTALQTVHYALGGNALNQSYITGYGLRPLLHPHHRPSVADRVQDPVPGMLAGGPNRNLQDAAARERLQNR